MSGKALQICKEKHLLERETASVKAVESW